MARRRSHGCVDTEHLALALFQLDGCVAWRVLARGNVFDECVRRELAAVSRAEPWMVSPHRPRRTPELRKAIDLALAAAERLGHPRVGTGHLLLGLLEEDGVVCRALCKAGIGRLGKNLSAVAEHVCREMIEPQERGEVADKALEHWHDGPRRCPDALPKPTPSKADRPVPVTPPTPQSREDAAITFLSVTLMVVAAVNLLPAGKDVSDMSRFIDVALFILGAAGLQFGGSARSKA
ncbi:MAG: Clp protease N-terminal domain-containing protein [Gemmataceae bacterium]